MSICAILEFLDFEAKKFNEFHFFYPSKSFFLETKLGYFMMSCIFVGNESLYEYVKSLMSPEQKISNESEVVKKSEFEQQISSVQEKLRKDINDLRTNITNNDDKMLENDQQIEKLKADYGYISVVYVIKKSSTVNSKTSFS